MSKLLVVIGITGTQGGSVASVYLNESGWKIRAISRNPAKAQAWADKGVEIVKGDLNDKESLISAFKGANAIFGVTDFWQPALNPANQSKLKPGQSMNQYAYDYEVQQGKNVADAAATVKDLDIFVFSSLSKSTYWSKGKYPHVYHFDSKAEVVDYMKQDLPKLWAKTSIFQPAMFMTNWKSALKPMKQPDGSFRMPCVGSSDVPVPQIFAQKDSGYFVRALIQSPPGLNLLGYGSKVSWKEYIQTFCDVVKVKNGGCDEMTVGDMDKMIPGGVGEELGEMFAYAVEFGYDGSDPSVISSKDLKVPCPTTSLREYFEQEDFSSIL